MVEIINDWSDGIDWSSVADPTGSGQPPRMPLHCHSYKWTEKPSDMIDLYVGDGTDDVGNHIDEPFTVTHGSDEVHEGTLGWPWTDLSDINDEWENRNPETVRGGEGVISYPARELRGPGDHVHGLFSTRNEYEDDYEATDTNEMIGEILENSNQHIPDDDGMAIIAHPSRYYWRFGTPTTEWDRYINIYDEYSFEDGLIGLEVLNKEATRLPNDVISTFGQPGETNPDVKLWDKLLTHYLPDRPLWGFAAEDGEWFEVGYDLSLRWNWLLLDTSEFEPSDQTTSRQAASDAVRDGRFLAVERQTWDTSKTSPQPATINNISVDGTTITIDAEGHDEIEWISRGATVATGSKIELTNNHIPYVRAEIRTNPSTLVLTQPWTLDGDGPETNIQDAYIDDAQF